MMKKKGTYSTIFRCLKHRMRMNMILNFCLLRRMFFLPNRSKDNQQQENTTFPAFSPIHHAILLSRRYYKLNVSYIYNWKGSQSIPMTNTWLTTSMITSSISWTLTVITLNFLAPFTLIRFRAWLRWFNWTYIWNWCKIIWKDRVKLKTPLHQVRQLKEEISHWKWVTYIWIHKNTITLFKSDR